MADEYKFPMRLRATMAHAAVVLRNSSSDHYRELDEDMQSLVRRTLDELDAACIEANMVMPTWYKQTAGAQSPRKPGARRVRIGHSTSYDYQTQLYDVVRSLKKLPADVTISLPHEYGCTDGCTRTFLAEGCNLFIAEVSAPSTGLGMEVAYAHAAGVPVVYLHHADCTPSSSLKMVSNTFLSYASRAELAAHLRDLITGLR